MTTKIERRIKIKYRVRNKVSGTAACPRMSVFRSNKQIYVQIIDDLSGKTLGQILPNPIWGGHDKELEMYWKAWEIAIGNIQIGRAHV